MKSNEFKDRIRHILNEEIQKRKGSQVNYTKDSEVVPHERIEMSQEELVDDLRKTCEDIDKDITVVLDDHRDISVMFKDLFNVRITQRWENNFNIVAFTRNEDRIIAIGLTWDQTKDFVKYNFEEAKETYVDGAKAKVDDNRKDKVDKSDLPQKGKPKVINLPDDARKMKSMNDEEDNPDKPMREVGDFKKQLDHKAKRPPTRGKGKPVTKFKDYQR